MRKTLLAFVAAVALGLGGCAEQGPTPEQLQLHQGQMRTEWMAAHHCDSGETYDSCYERFVAEQAERNRADWMAAHHCDSGETYNSCRSQLYAEERKLHEETIRKLQADPVWQEQQRQQAARQAAMERQAAADQLECQMLAQSTYRQVDLARPSILGLERPPIATRPITSACN